MADDQKETKEEQVEETKSESKASADLSKDAQKVLEMVEKMTVLELSDLVKAMEEKFGVSAAAPMAVAGVAAGGEVAKAEEKSAYDVVIKSAGEQKIAVIKAVRELDQALGLVEAKNLVETADAVVLKGVKKEPAEEAKKKLEEAGATVELR